jgi:hypothetical protein
MRPSRIWVGSVGFLALVAPRAVLAIHSKVNLLGFRNTAAVEPTDWLVSLTRIGGLCALGVAVVWSEPDTAESEDEDSIDFV